MLVTTNKEQRFENKLPAQILLSKELTSELEILCEPTNVSRRRDISVENHLKTLLNL